MRWSTESPIRRNEAFLDRATSVVTTSLTKDGWRSGWVIYAAMPWINSSHACFPLHSVAQERIIKLTEKIVVRTEREAQVLLKHWLEAAPLLVNMPFVRLHGSACGLQHSALKASIFTTLCCCTADTKLHHLAVTQFSVCAFISLYSNKVLTHRLPMCALLREFGSAASLRKARP